MNAQESERRRISRELRDDLSQKVAKLQFDIETLEQKIPFADIEDAKKKFAMPARPDRHARQRFAARRSRTPSLKFGSPRLDCRVALVYGGVLPLDGSSGSVREPESAAASPPEVASCLYRIVQEALRNVGKHASNAEVEIKLLGKPDGLELSIRDNGDGLDVEAGRAKGGLGLISMHERVRLVQGRFSLKTAPGRGVLISIQVPLQLETR